MKDWWQGLSQRERLLVSICGIVVIIGLVYFILWEPLSDSATKARQNVANNKTLLAWMNKANQMIQSSGKTFAPQKHTSVSEALVVIQKSLKTAKLESTVTQLQQSNKGDIRIKFKDIYFDSLSQWLVSLWKNHGIGVNQATITKGKSLGQVDVNLTLSTSQS